MLAKINRNILFILFFILLLGVLPAAAEQLEELRNSEVETNEFDRSLRLDLQETRLTSEDYANQPGKSGDNFGWAVAVDGDTAVVGSYRSDINALQDAGVAYVYERDSDDNWQLVKSIQSLDASIVDHFGTSVAIDGDTIVIGAAGKNLSGDRNEAGGAYIFERNMGGSNNWGQTHLITAADGASGDGFGGDVDIDGDFVIIGAAGVDIIPYNDRGAAYVFGRNEGGENNWGQIYRLFALEGKSLDEFGTSVAINNETAVVGAPGTDVDGISQQGVAYVFQPRIGAPDIWTEVTTLKASDRGVNNYFGASVDISKGTILIGSWGNNSNVGAAYIFSTDNSPAGDWEQVLRLVASDGIGGDKFGSSVTLDGSTAVVGASNANVTSREPRGSAYIFQRYEGGEDNWGRVTRIVALDGMAGDAYANSISISGNTVFVGAPGARVAGKSNQGAAYSLNWQKTCTPVTGSSTSLNDILGDAQCNPVLLIGSGTYLGCFDITHDTILQGTGVNDTILDGNNACTTVSLRAGTTIELRDLTITGGNGTAPGATGGGIYNDGAELLLSNVEIKGNTALMGGGIRNGESGISSLTILTSTIAENSATVEGGGIYAPSNAEVAIYNSTLSGNSSVSGGAISSYGELSLTNVTLAGNTNNGIYIGDGAATTANTLLADNGDNNCVLVSGMLVSNGNNLADDSSCNFIGTDDQQDADPLLKPLGNNGGETRTHGLTLGSPAINAGNNTICNGDFISGIDQRGVARPFGTTCDIGALESNQLACTALVNDGRDLEDLMLDDACSPILIPTGTYTGCFELDHNAEIIGTGAGETILEGAGNCPVVTVGPGVNTDIISVTLTGGSGPIGGAVNNDGGNVEVIDTIVTGNTATVGGGLNNTNGGTLTVDKSTIHGNTATEKGGAINNDEGSTVDIINSTLSGNHAPIGGALANEGTVYLTNSTIANNTNDGIYNRAGSIFMVNSLIATNETLNCIAMGGSFRSEGSNLADDSSCQLNNAGDRIVVDAGLRDLSNYGGETPVHGLEVDSPALNNGDAATCIGSKVNGVDQRGTTRPFGPGCDIGSFESDTARCDVSAENSAELTSTIQDASCSPIVVAPGTYYGCFTVNISAEIIGAGAGETIFEGDGDCTVMSIEPGLTVGISDVTITNGVGEKGGGIYNSGSDITLRDVVLTGNSADIGGAIYNDGNGAGTVSLINSSISMNNGILRGGGIFNGTGNTVNASNSTISSNTSFNGGGIYNRGDVSLVNATIAVNRSSGVHNVGTVIMVNSIIAKNQLENCSSSGTMITNGYNLSDDASCELTDRTDHVVSDALIGAMQVEADGSVMHMLKPESMALDNGRDSICFADPISNTDQRGKSRPQGEHCDIGALEVSEDELAISVTIYLPVIFK